MSGLEEKGKPGAGAESAEKPRGALFVIWDRGSDEFIIEERDQKSEHFKGMFNFPGEHAEEIDADIEETAVRGIFEECGFTPERGELAPLMDRLHKQPHAEGSVKVFVVELPDKNRVKLKPRGEGENAGMDWMSLEAIEKLVTDKKFGFGQESFFDEVKTYVKRRKNEEP